MNWKEFLTSKGVEDVSKETPEKLAELQSEYQSERFKAVDELLKETVKSGDLEEVKNAIESYKQEIAETNKNFLTEDSLKELNEKLSKSQEDLEEAMSEITSLKEKSKNKTPEAFKLEEDVINGIKKSLDDSVNRPFEFTVKAEAFTSTAITGTNTYAFWESGIDAMAHRKISLLNVFKRVPLPKDHSGIIKWREWDEATTAAVVTAIEEGNPFPESTVRWKENSESVKKVGTTIPVSEEFGVDETTLYNEISGFMRDYVELFEEEQIYNGTGLAGQLNGFYTQAPVYTAVAKGIDSANIYDLALDVKEDIGRGRGSKYEADTIIMNLGTVNKLYRTKNNDMDYLNVPFAVGQNGEVSIAGMVIVESNLVADDEMIVLDSARATIFEYEEYQFTTGHVNNQFNEDEATLKARKRMLLRIKSNDLIGFRKVTDIPAAITLLATP